MYQKIQRLTPQGDPADEIMTVAADWQADLIVIGSHGKTGLMHLMAGSVAEHVIRHAPVPVMIVPMSW